MFYQVVSVGRPCLCSVAPFVVGCGGWPRAGVVGAGAPTGRPYRPPLPGAPTGRPCRAPLPVALRVSLGLWPPWVSLGLWPPLPVGPAGLPAYSYRLPSLVTANLEGAGASGAGALSAQKEGWHILKGPGSRARYQNTWSLSWLDCPLLQMTRHS